jgi:glycosyltransferase involved in cell wall biosynthesis
MSRPARRIGLNGLFLDYPASGMRTYTRQLVPALAGLDPASEYRLSVRRVWPDWYLLGNVVPRRPLWPFSREGSTRSWIERVDKFAWEQVAWPQSAMGFDLLHSLYFAAPAWHAGPLVVTVHDCIPFRSDNRHSRAAGIYTEIMRKTTRRAAAIITVSNHARDEIIRIFEYPRDRVHVTPEAPSADLYRVGDAVAQATVRDRYNLPGRYLLYVGGTEARKNITTLVQAWATVPRRGVELVIVGRFPHDDPLYPHIPSLVGRLGINCSVRFVDRVAENDLASVYSGALAFCYPSRYEGFGLPPLEAMACGIPVLASNATSLPEVLGDGAELISPDDVEAWSRAIDRVVDDAEWRKELVARGTSRVGQYSWEKTARLTLDVYRTVLAR